MSTDATEAFPQDGQTATPLTVTDMTGFVQHGVNILFPGIADDPHDGAFELTAPATGQRFRVAVTEVPAWSDQMDRELAQIAGTEPQR
jgi:hypothetical protein